MEILQVGIHPVGMASQGVLPRGFSMGRVKGCKFVILFFNGLFRQFFIFQKKNMIWMQIFYRSSHPRSSIKSNFHRKTPVLESLYNKVAGRKDIYEQLLLNQVRLLLVLL